MVGFGEALGLEPKIDTDLVSHATRGFQMAEQAKIAKAKAMAAAMAKNKLLKFNNTGIHPALAAEAARITNEGMSNMVTGLQYGADPTIAFNEFQPQIDLLRERSKGIYGYFNQIQSNPDEHIYSPDVLAAYNRGDEEGAIKAAQKYDPELQRYLLPEHSGYVPAKKVDINKAWIPFGKEESNYDFSKSYSMDAGKNGHYFYKPKKEAVESWASNMANNQDFRNTVLFQYKDMYDKALTSPDVLKLPADQQKTAAIKSVIASMAPSLNETERKPSVNINNYPEGTVAGIDANNMVKMDGIINLKYNTDDDQPVDATSSVKYGYNVSTDKMGALSGTMFSASTGENVKAVGAKEINNASIAVVPIANTDITTKYTNQGGFTHSITIKKGAIVPDQLMKGKKPVGGEYYDYKPVMFGDRTIKVNGKDVTQSVYAPLTQSHLAAVMGDSDKDFKKTNAIFEALNKGAAELNGKKGKTVIKLNG